jgi:hypothetical protein
MELKQLTPRSNARYEEAGEIDLEDGTWVAVFRYPEGKIRLQFKHPKPDQGRFAVSHLASATGVDEGTQIMLVPCNAEEE